MSTTAAVGTLDGDARIHLVLFKPADLYGLGLSFISAAKRTPVFGTWENLCKLLSRSVVGDPKLYPDPNIAKRARGAWVPGKYAGTHGHGDLSKVFISTELLVVDVDAGDPHAVAEVLAAYRVIVHSTYKHTLKAPRCRVVFRLASPCRSVTAYNTGLKYIAKVLSERGFVVPAKDSTLGRLAYLPMHQPNVEPVFIVNDGKPLDFDRIVAAVEEDIPHAPQRKPSNPSTAYAQGALRHASERVVSARDGERHNLLFKEAASLARPELALDERSILDVLLPAARHADPDEHPREHERTIRDAIRKARAT